MKRLILVALLGLLSGVASAQETYMGAGHKCIMPPFLHDPSPPIQLSSEQSAFLKGLWAGNENTPPGLPYGLMAAWITKPDGGAIAFFVDGEMRCDALILDKTAVDMTMDVARGISPHAGESN